MLLRQTTWQNELHWSNVPWPFKECPNNTFCTCYYVNPGEAAQEPHRICQIFTDDSDSLWVLWQMILITMDILLLACQRVGEKAAMGKCDEQRGVSTNNERNWVNNAKSQNSGYSCCAQLPWGDSNYMGSILTYTGNEMLLFNLVKTHFKDASFPQRHPTSHFWY